MLLPRLETLGILPRRRRSAKLKQCKLDARRQQWLSQVKNKVLKDAGNGDPGDSMPARNEGNRSLEILEIPNHQESDWDSPSSSPSTVLGGNEGVNYTESSGNSSSGGFSSGGISEEEDDGCLDDWEAFVDALGIDDKQQNSNVDPGTVNVSLAQSELEDGLAYQTGPGGGEVKTEHVRVMRPQLKNGHAWRPDDAFRPQSLPNLTKQYSCPMKLDMPCALPGTITWACESNQSVLSSCLICSEDLDTTDTSFLPCPCGFRLCLFCHKRILEDEDDGRCPGCRKTYNRDPVESKTSINEGTLTFRLGRSYSLITRS